jgi:hypothetical protein
VVGAQHGFRIGEENPALRNFFRIPCGTIDQEELEFPLCKHEMVFFFFDNREIQRSLSFHNEKKKNKNIENIGPPIIPFESFPYVLLIQL